ncbi:putative RNA polymerase sigma factor FecI [Pigmentiphaga humi]|uniref:Putative RNA polymerase sigma factor FecI n=1 Tax=Pigmentiphaga humi TaxID=2478468 RepID=A0A3P4AWJ3_9BURK|nr:sigma-70 family RNA polymerase sigma factor [Pigmentiphaga humi]VCU68092.1 putative RNA polymerase sigma factor FecI [Pigmentiphaga humi]
MTPSQPHPQDTVHRLYREHHAWLVQLLRRKLGDMEHAADLAHDTFERIMRADLGPVVAAPRAYLTTVAQRLAASHFRRAAVSRAFQEALAARPEAIAPSPEQQLQFQQSLLAVLDVLDGLPLRTRRIFLLAQFDGLPHNEIAQQLGITPNAVQKAVARALEHCYLAIYPSAA